LPRNGAIINTTRKVHFIQIVHSTAYKLQGIAGR